MSTKIYHPTEDDRIRDTVYATALPRFLAHWLDILVIEIALMPVGFVLRKVFIEESPTLGWISDGLFLLILAYPVIGHGLFSGTIGKWLMGVRVVKNTDHSTLGLSRAFVRDGLVPLLWIALSFTALDPSAVFTGLIVWSWLEIGTMLTNDKRRAIHDFMAGSVVMRVGQPFWMWRPSNRGWVASTKDLEAALSAEQGS